MVAVTIYNLKQYCTWRWANQPNLNSTPFWGDGDLDANDVAIDIEETYPVFKDNDEAHAWHYKETMNLISPIAVRNQGTQFFASHWKVLYPSIKWIPPLGRCWDIYYTNHHGAIYDTCDQPSKTNMDLPNIVCE
jgi:hypothetical protein